MRSVIPGDVLISNASVSTTNTGSWVQINNRAIPFDGIALVVALLKGVASGGSATVRVQIQDSLDGSTVNASLYDKTFTVTTGGNSFEEDPRIFSNGFWMRSLITITGTFATPMDVFIGVVTGDIM